MNELCKYKGLGCAKEDVCDRRGEFIEKCALRRYFVYLDEFSGEKEIYEEDK